MGTELIIQTLMTFVPFDSQAQSVTGSNIKVRSIEVKVEKMKIYSIIFLILLVASCKQEHAKAPANSNSFQNSSYEATPVLAGMKLDEQQLLENIKWAKNGNQIAVDKLIDHYLFIGNLNSHYLWCYEGARLGTTKGLFCIAGVEYEKGGRDNCLRVIALYKKIELQASKSESAYFAQLLGLDVSKPEIKCVGRFWSKTPVKKDMQTIKGDGGHSIKGDGGHSIKGDGGH